jgi:electron transport complex protein RnfE
MIQTFSKGLIDENPLCVYVLGLCPVLAVSSRVIDALAMGIALLVILIIVTLVMSAVKDYVPDRFRIFVCTAVAGSCASMTDLIMRAYMPGLSDELGIFVPLITVNALILDRALNFAKENTPSVSFWDGLGMGLGFLLALLGVSVIREILGSGTITLVSAGSFSGVITIPGLSQSPIRAVSLSAGGFLVLGYLKAVFDLLSPSIRKNARKGKQ